MSDTDLNYLFITGKSAPGHFPRTCSECVHYRSFCKKPCRGMYKNDPKWSREHTEADFGGKPESLESGHA
jgi:hypothetical protein